MHSPASDLMVIPDSDDGDGAIFRQASAVLQIAVDRNRYNSRCQSSLPCALDFDVRQSQCGDGLGAQLGERMAGWNRQPHGIGDRVQALDALARPPAHAHGPRRVAFRDPQLLLCLVNRRFGLRRPFAKPKRRQGRNDDDRHPQDDKGRH